MSYTYALDTTGVLLANKITGEQQILTAPNHRNYHFIVPQFAPYFADSLSIVYKDLDNNTRTLVEGIDYHPSFQYIGASRACAKAIYGGITFLNLQLTGVVTLVYQTLGGEWTLDASAIAEILSDTLRNPRTTTWEQVAAVPTVFPPVDHEWNLDDLVGMSEVNDQVEAIALAIANKPPSNPFEGVDLYPTKQQIGLGNVDNYKTASDAEAVAGTSITRFMTPKGVKLAIQNALAGLNTAASVLAELIKKTGSGLIGTLTGQTLKEAVLCVNTIAELRALEAPAVAAGKTVYIDVLGEAAIGDAKMARFYWSVDHTGLDNGITIVKPLSNPVSGRWINILSDAWIVDNYVITTGQTTTELTKAPVYGRLPKIVVNNCVELVYKIDYELNGKTVTYFYPLEAGDLVHACTQVKALDTNHVNDNVYYKFTVSDVNASYALAQAPMYPESLRVVLNDFVILTMPGEFEIEGSTLTISYPLEVGDSLELVSHSQLVNYGTFGTREIIGY